MRAKAASGAGTERARMIEDQMATLNELEKEGESDPLAEAIHTLLRELGEDPRREGLIRTPGRVARSLRFLTSGYHQELDKVLNGALFPVAYDEMVIVKDIEIFSICEHHLLPFFGKCHVAYIPNQKVIGLSKIPRVVDVFAKRLQIQERLTTQIAEALMERIKPQGVGVIIEAKHLCMIMRGVEKQNSVAVTSHMTGVFRDCELTRAEFLRLVRERQ
jgi:GTP cyclohydrolase I